jgi:8-oxo-dGTP pyrophosphatase MutT (NUDIX family)
MGAGILPVTVYRNKIYLLYGRENVDDKNNKDRGKWSDFGGSTEKGESAFQTAVREGWEETAGILGSKTKIKNLIKYNLLDKISWDKDGKGIYTIFLVLIPYDSSLPKKLDKVYKNALKNEPEKVFAHNGLFEKDKAEWIPLEKLKSRVKTFRKWYQPLVYDTIDFFNNPNLCL